MLKTAKLILLDEVNCKISDLDVGTRRKCMERLKFYYPYARNLPAVKMGRWDGSVAYFTQGGGTFIPLLPRLSDILEEAGYELEIEDRREAPQYTFEPIDENYLADHKWPKGHRLAGQPIVMNDHQVGAINALLTNTKSVVIAATSSGKTIVTAAISRKVEQYGRTIVIVPSRKLVEQTKEDYELIGLDTGVFYGKEKVIDKKHTICTWQSLDRLSKKSKDGLSDIEMEEFFKDVVAVIVDEAHASKADSLKNLLSHTFKNIPIRWGLTGTIPKDKMHSTCIEAMLGPVVFEISAAELQEKGILSKCQVDVIQLHDTNKFTDYRAESAYLNKDENRLLYLATLLEAIIENGNTLVLVNNIETGNILEQMLLEKKQNVAFVHGSTKDGERDDHYDSIQEANDKIIIATYGVASVGINIPRVFNLVLFEAGKSFIRCIQSIGRSLRLAHDKDFANIYDFCSTNKYSTKHLKERVQFYNEAKYPVEILKIKDWSN